MSVAWLVVGLGNPGRSYAAHRHNAGYLVVENLAARAEVRFAHSLRLGADIAQTRLTAGGELGGVGDQAGKVVLMKSRTFMNDSGRAVQRVSGYFDISAKSIVVVHDELDLEPGQIRLKFGGGDNGHNGLKSIRRHLGSGDFYRVRIGIGRPPGSQPASDYVLEPVAASHRDSFEVDVERAGDAVLTLLVGGLEAAQNQFNS